MTRHSPEPLKALSEQICQITSKPPESKTMTILHDLAGSPGRGPTVLCRALIAAGADPEEHIEFTRGTTQVFAATPIRWWAARRVREADAGGPIRFVLCAN